MPQVIISTIGINDSDLTQELYDVLVDKHSNEFEKIEILPTGTDDSELGIMEVIGVSIGATNLLINVIKWVLEWRKSQKQEQDRDVDLRIQLDDCVIEIRRNG